MTLKNKNPYPNETTHPQRINSDQATAQLEAPRDLFQDAVKAVNGGES